jgi:hypothetical protein
MVVGLLVGSIFRSYDNDLASYAGDSDGGVEERRQRFSGHDVIDGANAVISLGKVEDAIHVGENRVYLMGDKEYRRVMVAGLPSN